VLDAITDGTLSVPGVRVAGGFALRADGEDGEGGVAEAFARWQQRVRPPSAERSEGREAAEGEAALEGKEGGADEGGGSGGKGACYVCGDPTHWASACPRRASAGGGAPRPDAAAALRRSLGDGGGPRGRAVQAVFADGTRGPWVSEGLVSALRAGGPITDKCVLVGPIVPVRRERDLFDALGLAYIPPHMRNV
jgi:hypothetical protein